MLVQSLDDSLIEQTFDERTDLLPASTEAKSQVSSDIALPGFQAPLATWLNQDEPKRQEQRRNWWPFHNMHKVSLSPGMGSNWR